MIYATGDFHGGHDHYKLSARHFPQEKQLTKDDFVVICGDFGCVWDGGGEDLYWQKWLSDKPYTTLFVDGNHENHELLGQFEVTEWNGGKVQFITDSIIHLMRGQVYTIDGKRVFAMGGAQSHDKQYRKENVSWWSAELPDKDEYAEAQKNLDACCWKVDYVFTHCASAGIALNALNRGHADELMNFLQDVRQRLDYGHWFFGHYHVEFQIDEKHTCLYNEIVNAAEPGVYLRKD